MKSPFRRLADGATGAVVATILLAGGAAYAATNGIDDNPHRDDSTSVTRGTGADDTPGADDNSSTDDTPSTTLPPGATTSTSSASVPTTTIAVPASTPTAPAASGTAYPVLDAGTVTVAVDASVLHIVRADAAPQWVAHVERDNAREIEVNFASGSARVDFTAELEDNEVRVRVRDRRTETPTSSTSTSTSIPTTTTASGDDGATTTRTLHGNGGSVTVRQAANSVVLVVATPAAGFAADVRSTGPDKVEVRFSSSRAETRIEIERKDGQSRERVEDR
jgi:hypothetical protein